MSSLREPHLGPIVGHTTDRSCRLWIRAFDSADRKADLADDRRTIGVLAVISVGGQDLAVDARPVFYFRLRREYDRTGTFNLGVERSLGGQGAPFPLQPDTLYRVRMGTMSVDDPLPNEEDLDGARLAQRLPAPEVWRAELDRDPLTQHDAIFRTFKPAAAVDASLSFLLGSCRYPGILFQEREADQIFGPMLREAEGRDGRAPVRFALMIGDQIYADKFNRLIPLGRADTFEEFQERYHTAWGSLAMRRLLRKLPAYMMLDDHEIEDNWTQDRVSKEAGRNLYLNAIRAYLSYQWSHGPRTWEGPLYYTFECNGYPVFALDTRTQRYVDDVDDESKPEESLADNHLLGRPALAANEPNQLSRFLDWLTRQQQTRDAVPKFVVTPSVFVPNDVTTTKGPAKKLKDDSWPAFPETRRAVLDHIVKNKIQNVVFLSGDIHCTNVTTMRFDGSDDARALRAVSITSSALYWPFPFADGNPADYVHDSKDPRTPDTFKVSSAPDITMDYTASGFTQEDNFCRIDVDRAGHKLVVHVFDWKGARVQTEDLRGNRRDLISELDLAGW
jgi:alkaline phosphatase D